MLKSVYVCWRAISCLLRIFCAITLFDGPVQIHELCQRSIHELSFNYANACIKWLTEFLCFTVSCSAIILQFYAWIMLYCTQLSTILCDHESCIFMHRSILSPTIIIIFNLYCSFPALVDGSLLNRCDERRRRRDDAHIPLFAKKKRRMADSRATLAWRRRLRCFILLQILSLLLTTLWYAASQLIHCIGYDPLLLTR